MAEYRQGQGPQQLPEGAASQVNAALPPPDAPVNYAPHGYDQQLLADPRQASDNMSVLDAPPDPRYQPPPLDTPAGQVPRSIVRNLPRIMAAAKDPDAPASLKALYLAVVRQLSQ